MKKILFLALFLFGQVGLADDCIRLNSIRSFDAIDSSTLTIEAFRSTYTMKVSFCPDLPWTQRIGFQTFSSFQVCEGDRLLVLDNWSAHIKDRCFIRKITKNQ